MVGAGVSPDNKTLDFDADFENALKVSKEVGRRITSVLRSPNPLGEAAWPEFFLSQVATIG